jgi:hypothetical protein
MTTKKEPRWRAAAAGQKQLDFIRSLASRKQLTGDQAQAVLQAADDGMTAGQASDMIDTLLKFADRPLDPSKAPTPGVYRHHDTIYVLQLTKPQGPDGERHIYAKRLIGERNAKMGSRRFVFEYAPGVARYIRRSERLGRRNPAAKDVYLQCFGKAS